MYEFTIAWDWIEFALRWLHVITAIAWIGSSFYFIALDLGLRKVPNLPKGANGEEWQVHGGGFYHIQKYLVAPEQMPEHLTWFKWESYMTWISGFAVMCVVYYANAELYLIDRNVLDVSSLAAIGISVASIVVGWLLYDNLCKLFLGKSDTGLMIALFVVLVAAAWGYTQVFTGRAAFLHLGAFTATIMSANVAMIIIPNQKIVVADLIAGNQPDPVYGMIAKQRSTHNNYLTLPVIFFMLSNHYPLAFATEFNWVIATLVFLIGVVIRHYFNERHSRRSNPTWTWLIAGLAFIIIMWLSTVPKVLTGSADGSTMLSQSGQELQASQHFAGVEEVVMTRCSMCHTAEPVWDGIHRAPKGVYLDSGNAIANQGKQIYLHAGRSHAMPPGNLTNITDDERQLIVRWFETASTKEIALK